MNPDGPSDKTPQAPRVRAVVFDLDGLLFNTEEIYPLVGTELCRRRGHPYTDELHHQMMGRPGRVSLQMMIDFHQLDDTIEGLANETDEIFPAILDRSLAPMPGVLDLLAALEAGNIPKAIATSSGRAFTQGVLARFELEPRFRFLLTSEDVTDGKPHPDAFKRSLGQVPLNKTWTRYVIDLSDLSEKDLLSVIGAFAWVASGGYDKEDRIVTYIADLKVE